MKLLYLALQLTFNKHISWQTRTSSDFYPISAIS